MQKTSLKDFAAWLREQPLEQDTPQGPISFNFGTWCSKLTCGTSACAIGLGILKGQLPGLELQFVPWDKRDPSAGWFRPHYNGNVQLGAIQEYFGISQFAAGALFTDDEEVSDGDGGWKPVFPEAHTPQDVAARIEAFLNDPAIIRGHLAR